MDRRHQALFRARKVGSRPRPGDTAGPPGRIVPGTAPTDNLFALMKRAHVVIDPLTGKIIRIIPKQPVRLVRHDQREKDSARPPELKREADGPAEPSG